MPTTLSSIVAQDTVLPVAVNRPREHVDAKSGQVTNFVDSVVIHAMQREAPGGDDDDVNEVVGKLYVDEPPYNMNWLSFGLKGVALNLTSAIRSARKDSEDSKKGRKTATRYSYSGIAMLNRKDLWSAAEELTKKINAAGAAIEGWDNVTLVENREGDGVHGLGYRCRFDSSVDVGGALGGSGCVIAKRLRIALNLRVVGSLSVPDDAVDIAVLSGAKLSPDVKVKEITDAVCCPHFEPGHFETTLQGNVCELDEDAESLATMLGLLGIKEADTPKYAAALLYSGEDVDKQASARKVEDFLSSRGAISKIPRRSSGGSGMERSLLRAAAKAAQDESEEEEEGDVAGPAAKKARGSM